MAKKKEKTQTINNIQNLNVEIDYDKLAESIVKAQEKVEETAQKKRRYTLGTFATPLIVSISVPLVEVKRICTTRRKRPLSNFELSNNRIISPDSPTAIGLRENSAFKQEHVVVAEKITNGSTPSFTKRNVHR